MTYILSADLLVRNLVEVLEIVVTLHNATRNPITVHPLLVVLLEDRGGHPLIKVEVVIIFSIATSFLLSTIHRSLLINHFLHP